MVEFKMSGDELRCVFSGRLDTPACQQLEPELTGKIDAGPAVVVFDLAKVSYISSLFFRLCIQTSQKLDTGSFSIVNAQPDVKNVFRVAGLAQMLNVQ